MPREKVVIYQDTKDAGRLWLVEPGPYHGTWTTERSAAKAFSRTRAEVIVGLRLGPVSSKPGGRFRAEARAGHRRDVYYKGACLEKSVP